MPAVKEADEYVPMSGRWCVNTSRLRIVKSALSPVGIQPSWIARAVATATGSKATTSDPRNRRKPNRVAGGEGPTAAVRWATGCTARSVLMSSDRLARTDEHGCRETEDRHPHQLLARRLRHPRVQAEPEQVLVDGANEVGQPRRLELVD